MKKTLSLIISLIALTMLTSCKAADIKLLMPGSYIDKSIVRSFEKETGKKVSIVPFDSNEAALTKLKTEKFDLIIPSDYMIEQMIKEDLLQKVDWNKIPDFNKETDFPEELKALLDELGEDFPILDYSIPYFWGNLGILYNKKKVSKTLLEQEQWNIFRNEEIEKIVMYDSARDGFFVALKHLGYSGNTDVESELIDAEKYLTDMAKQSNIVFLTDEILDDMKVSKYDISLTYSGDAVYLMDSNDDLDFYVPTIGSNVFVDAFAIPKESRDLDLVYAFINHMSKYQNALNNTLEIMYQSPRKDVYELMISRDSELYHLVNAYKVVRNENDELFRYVPSAKAFIDDSWAKIRSSN